MIQQIVSYCHTLFQQSDVLELRMFSASSLGRGLLLTSMLVSTACSDLNLSRIRAPAADSAEPGHPPKPSAPTGDEGRPTPAMANAGFAELRRNLRRLVAAEETFFAENGTYSDDMSLIGLRPDQNTTIRFLWLSRDGWAASGTHTALPGRDCVIFVGQARRPPTTLKYTRRGREGVPVCDDSRVSAPAPSAPRAAQPAKPESAPPDTANALDLLDPRVLMKVDLRNLAHSQETFFAMQGIYARRPETMALQYLWHRDVRVKILEADAQSWAAKATHARFPGKSCVIWYGPVAQRPVTDAQRRRESRAGVPVCDE
jgi:hypothetical protein